MSVQQVYLFSPYVDDSPEPSPSGTPRSSNSGEITVRVIDHDPEVVRTDQNHKRIVVCIVACTAVALVAVVVLTIFLIRRD